MSKINVDTWEPESGNAAILMASGDTVTLPDGAILAVASGGDINVASGGEIDIASGATLDVNGTIDLTGATTTGFPAGGLTHASQWRLTTSFTGLATPITLNLEQVDAPVGFGVLGSSMTEASGIFTFPSTGYWRIDYQQANDPTTTQGGSLSIFTTTNDSTYVAASVGFWNGYYDNSGAQTSYIMDVTDTTTHKVQFHVNWNSSSATQTTLGSTDIDYTYMTFLRLADT